MIVQLHRLIVNSSIFYSFIQASYLPPLQRPPAGPEQPPQLGLGGRVGRDVEAGQLLQLRREGGPAAQQPRGQLRGRAGDLGKPIVKQMDRFTALIETN